MGHGESILMKRKDEIQKSLRGDIILGKLMQGERITESELTLKFNCSRGTVREALVQLSKDGFIEHTRKQRLYRQKALGPGCPRLLFSYGYYGIKGCRVGDLAPKKQRN